MRDGCAARSRACGEPLHGTASRARRWLLFEHPGAWGAEVLEDGTLPAPISRRLRVLAADLPARVLLIRHPDPRRQPATRRVRLLAGVTAPGGRWLEELVLDDPADLLDLDLSPLGDHASVGGRRVERPRYLVCTNGRHDACCAEYGRPVVAALHPVLGDRLWECSHVGGDRFAGNLVSLPSGAFYGRLDAASALTVVAASERGELDLAHWRGRSDRPFPVQAAEALVRARLGLVREDALQVVGSRREPAGQVVVELRTGDGTHIRAVVRADRDATRRTLTCADAPRHAPVHVLDAFEVLPPEAD